MILVAGCGSVSQGEIEQIRQAYADYRNKRYAEAERALSPIINRHADDPAIAEALYLRGLTLLHRDQRAPADRDFSNARALCRDDELRALIDVQLGHLRFSDGHYEAACRLYESARTKFPEDARPDELEYQYGLSLLRSGRFKEARHVLREIPRQFPKSTYATAAWRKSVWPHDYFTVQSGAFSSRGKAEDAANQWRTRGMAVSVSDTDEGGPELYRVQVGRFPTYRAARTAWEDIRQTAPDAFIVP